jgi:hypothetical protein
VAHTQALYVPVDYGDEESPDPDWGMLDEAAGTIRRALTDLGFQQHVAG